MTKRRTTGVERQLVECVMEPGVRRPPTVGEQIIEGLEAAIAHERRELCRARVEHIRVIAREARGAPERTHRRTE